MSAAHALEARGLNVTLLKMDLEAALHTRLRSIAHIHRLPMDARSVTDELMTMEGK